MTRPLRTTMTLGALVAALAAPTPGDVGGCGRAAELADMRAFERDKKLEDCRRCQACSLFSERCLRACDPLAPAESLFSETCFPIQHDVAVCLRALRAAPCSDVGAYMSDEVPSAPSECNFCLGGSDGGGP